jgi:hypothetical protein
MNQNPRSRWQRSNKGAKLYTCMPTCTRIAAHARNGSTTLPQLLDFLCHWLHIPLTITSFGCCCACTTRIGAKINIVSSLERGLKSVGLTCARYYLNDRPNATRLSWRSASQEFGATGYRLKGKRSVPCTEGRLKPVARCNARSQSAAPLCMLRLQQKTPSVGRHTSHFLLCNQGVELALLLVIKGVKWRRVQRELRKTPPD